MPALNRELKENLNAVGSFALSIDKFALKEIVDHFVIKQKMNPYVMARWESEVCSDDKGHG
jgi:hypothetical protein